MSFIVNLVCSLRQLVARFYPLPFVGQRPQGRDKTLEVKQLEEEIYQATVTVAGQFPKVEPALTKLMDRIRKDLNRSGVDSDQAKTYIDFRLQEAKKQDLLKPYIVQLIRQAAPSFQPVRRLGQPPSAALI